METFLLSWKMKFLLFSAAVLAPEAAIVALAAAVVRFSAEASSYMGRYCADLSFDNRIGAYFETLKDRLYSGGAIDQIEASLSSLKSQAASLENLAWIFALYTLIFAVATLAFRDGGVKGLVNRAIFVSAVFLFVGLASPMLNFQASKVVSFSLKQISASLPDREIINLGETVFKYESKGVAGTTAALLASGKLSGLVPGLFILLFSVVFPAAKLASAFLSHNGYVDPARTRAILALGKWSMADVFIVAILLSLLALNAQEMTKASLGPGFYFFALYWCLSTAAGHFVAGESLRTERS